MIRLLLFNLLTGFIGLGYVVCWLRIYAEQSGLTTAVPALILCSVAIGLALGAGCSRRLCCHQTGFMTPLRACGLVAILVTALMLLTPLAGLMSADFPGSFPYQIRNGIYVRAWSGLLVKILVIMTCIILPCFFMGLTFPILSDSRSCDRPLSAPRILVTRSLGACAGICGWIGFVHLLPGHHHMFWILVVLNGIVGILFIVAGNGVVASSVPASNLQTGGENYAGSCNSPVLFTYIGIGGFLLGALAGDSYMRIRMVTGDWDLLTPLGVFWAILAFTLSGWTSLIPPCGVRPRLIRIGLILAVLFHGVIWLKGYALCQWLIGRVQDPFLEGVSGSLSASEQLLLFPASLGQLALVTGLFFFLPVYLVSLLPFYALNRLWTHYRSCGRPFTVFFLTTGLGLAGFVWLAPHVNIFYSLKLFTSVFIIGTCLVLLVSEKNRMAAWKPNLALIALVLAVLWTPDGFNPEMVPPGSPAAVHPARDLRSNGHHTTYVINAPSGNILHRDIHVLADTRPPAQVAARLLAHFPLLLHPSPRDVLIVGYGAGTTASAAAAYECIERIDSVDSNHQVFRSAGRFAGSSGKVHLDSRVRLIHDDGRNFLKVTVQQYDLVTGELPSPLIAGAGRFYCVEYYRQVLGRLRPGGMMTQSFPAHQLSPDAIDLLIETFTEVFPHTLMFSGSGTTFILLGSNSAFDAVNIGERWAADRDVIADLRRVGVRTPLHLLARVVKDDAGLRRDFGPIPVVRDGKYTLARKFTRPLRREYFSYDPHEVLQGLGMAGMEGADELGQVVTHPGRLLYHVRDFPLELLDSITDSSDDGGNPGHVNWWDYDRAVRYAAQLKRKGQADAAIGVLEEILEISGEQPVVLAMLAGLYAESGRAEAAYGMWQQLLLIEPADPTGYLESGKLMMAHRQVGGGVKYLERALALDPDLAEAHILLGTIFITRGEQARGLEHYRRAASLAPREPKVLITLAFFLVTRESVGKEDVEEAVRLAVKAAELTEYLDAKTLAALAEVFAVAGLWNEAVMVGEAAYDLAGDDSALASMQAHIRARINAYHVGPGE